MNEIISFIEYNGESSGTYILFFNDMIAYINNNINTINKEYSIYEVFLLKKVFINGINKIYNTKSNIVENS